MIDHFRKKAEEKDARERYLTDTYAKLSNAWNKRVERAENNRKRKERDAKSRELYEKIFPELRKQREDKERDHRLGTRGAVRSEADIEDVIERLQEQEVKKIVKSLLVTNRLSETRISGFLEVGFRTSKLNRDILHFLPNFCHI